MQFLVSGATALCMVFALTSCGSGDGKAQTRPRGQGSCEYRLDFRGQTFVPDPSDAEARQSRPGRYLGRATLTPCAYLEGDEPTTGSTKPVGPGERVRAVQGRSPHEIIWVRRVIMVPLDPSGN